MLPEDDVPFETIRMSDIGLEKAYTYSKNWRSCNLSGQPRHEEGKFGGNSGIDAWWQE
jgi:hypothetical protein